MELLYIFRTLNRKKWIIIITGILAAGATFLLTLNSKKLFKSQSQMSTGYTISEELKLSEDNFNLPQIDVKFNNVIENITSPKVLNLLSYKLILRDLSSEEPFTKPDQSELDKNEKLKGLDYENAKRIFKNKGDSLLLLRSNNKVEKQLLDLLEIYKYDIESIKKKLYVARYQRTDYINIFFRSENPELSAYVVNQLIKEFQRYFDYTRRERSLESMIALDSISRKRKGDLDEKIRTKSVYLSDSVISTLDPNMVGANKLSQINMYESGLAEEISRVQNLTYQIEQIEIQLNNLGVEKSVTNTSSGDNKLYFSLRKQYNDLYDEYIKSGASDAGMKTRLDDLQRRMQQAAPTGTPTTDNSGYNNSQRSGLTRTKIDLEGSLRSANSKIGFYKLKLSEAGSIILTNAPKTAGKLEELDKEIEIATLEYTSAKERLTMASNISDAGVSNFKQTLFGQPALKPEPSKRLIMMALAGFTGVTLSAIFFIFLVYIDQSIKTPSQFQRQTGTELLGTINFVNLKATNLKEQIVQMELEETNRGNVFRELLRKLRYEIESSDKRIILFTSTEPQQGKTTLMQALAFSLSLSKKKVLLIDTNFCNNDLTVYNDASPSLEQFSSLDQSPEFSDVQKIISKTGVEDVDIIGCKGGDYTPSEILPKNHLLNFLPDFLKIYDFIFLEGAPLNGYTDTKELAQYADGIIAIFSAKEEIEQADKESIKYFKTVKTKFLGSVLNKVDDKDLNL